MRRNTPNEVVILVGIALTEHGFHERVKTSDWLTMFSDPHVAENYWRDVYHPLVVEPMKEMLDYAREVGTEVADGTLENLRRCSSEKQVLIIMAHWKDSKVKIEDLDPVLPASQWQHLAAQGSSPLAHWLTIELKRHCPVSSVLNKALAADLAGDVATSLTSIIQESPVTRAARRRDEIDALFRGAIQPGNRLELLDGLHSKETFELALADAFEGTIDFAACTSTILADHVAHSRSNRVRTVQAQNPIEFVATAIVVKGTLELLTSGMFSYQEAHTYAKGFVEGAVCEL